MIRDPLMESQICPKHNLELNYLHPDQTKSQQQLACRQCIDEFHHVIPLKQLIESNSMLIKNFETQAKQNSITFSLLIHSLISLREMFNKNVENLIIEIRNQIQIDDEIIVNIKDKILKEQEIKLQHQKFLETQRMFQEKVILILENFKLNPNVDYMIQTLNKLNLQGLNQEMQFNKMSIVDQQSSLNKIEQNNQKVKRYEYQLLPQSEIEHRRNCWVVAFNKNNSLMAAGYSDDIKVFEHKNEKLTEIQLLKSHSNCITQLQFMKKSNQLISGSWDKTIKIWQQDNNHNWINTETLVGHENFILCVIINQNEDLIVSGGIGNEIIFWKWINNKWINHQTNKCTDQLYSLSLNDSNTKLIASDYSKSIQIFEQKESKWEIFQIINTDERGLRICFISDTNFVFLPYCSKYLHFYNQNEANKQFEKIDELQIKNFGSDKSGFPIQFITCQNLLVVKNCKCVNVLRKQENFKFILDQEIEFSHISTHGSVSNDGQLLVIWNYESQKMELRKLVQIM